MVKTNIKLCLSRAEADAEMESMKRGPRTRREDYYDGRGMYAHGLIWDEEGDGDHAARIAAAQHVVDQEDRDARLRDEDTPTRRGSLGGEKTMTTTQTEPITMPDTETARLLMREAVYQERLQRFRELQAEYEAEYARGEPEDEIERARRLV